MSPFPHRPHRFADERATKRPGGGGVVSALLNVVVSGWRVLSIINYRAAFRLRPRCRATSQNTGVPNQRPNRIGDGALDDATIDQWFGKTAFAAREPYTYGNSRRGILRADHLWNADASAIKRVSLPRGSNLGHSIS